MLNKSNFLIKGIIFLIIIIYIYSFSIFSTLLNSESTNVNILLEIGNPVMFVNFTESNIDPISTDTVPVIVQSRTLLPIRAIIEAIGGQIDWDAESRLVTIDVNGQNIKLSMANPVYVEHLVYSGESGGMVSLGLYEGNKTIMVNGQPDKNDVPAMIINERTFMPLRFIAENAGCKVDWYDEKKQVIITYPDPSAIAITTDTPTPVPTTVLPTTTPATTVPITTVPTTTAPTVTLPPTVSATIQPSQTPTTPTLTPVPSGTPTGIPEGVEGWDMVPYILDSIKPIVFPDNDFDITTYGAVGDGQTDCLPAIKTAIDECNSAGGGRVVVPPGEYFVEGPIHLKSNVNLHISKDAKILFTKDYSKYLPVVFSRYGGVELMNYSPLIYAFEQENIAITGEGIVDGGADENTWWPWKSQYDSVDRQVLFQMAADGVPVEERDFSNYHIRTLFIQPYRCKNVLIDGITVNYSPRWCINPVLCENVTVKNVTVDSHGPNNDGCNPESCKNVLISNCYFNTGDDCIAIKSGRNEDGRRINVPCENIVIKDCTMKDGHGGVVIGSEISGGARNIFAEDCIMDSEKLDRALRIKTNSERGGIVENIYLRKIEVNKVGEAVIKVNFHYEEGDTGDFTPIVRNITVEHLVSRDGGYALFLSGYKDSPITNVRLINCTFENLSSPEPVSLEHVEDIVFENVFINGKLYFF